MPDEKVHQKPDSATIDFDAETGLFVFANPSDGTMYKMTTPALREVLGLSSFGDLQSVTDIGNVTDNSISIINDDTANFSTASVLGFPSATIQNHGGTGQGGLLSLVNNNGQECVLLADNLTESHLLQAPDLDGILPLSVTVNGVTYTADSFGDINLGTL